MRSVQSDLSFLCLATTLLVPACDPAGDTGATAVVRDSAGVTIVENSGGIWEAGREWRASSEPFLDIGVLEGAPEYQLFRVRNALRLSNGNIVVAASNELRFFDSEGRYLSTSGREGGGPGEFEGLGWVLSYPGDSIVAYDFNQLRVSLLDLDGEFGRSYSITPGGGFSFVLGEAVFADGTLLVKAPLAFRGGFENGAMRRDEAYHSYSTNGEFIDSVATLPGPDQFIRTGSEGQSRFVMVTSPPFGRDSHLAVAGNQFYFGSADRYEIERRAKDGGLNMIIRARHSPQVVTDDAVSRYIDRELADMDEAQRREMRDSYEEMPVPEVMPAYSDIKVDAAGNVWVQDYEADDEIASRWTVFDRGGQMLGSVTLGAGFEVNQIGDDHVLGVWHDEFDVEHVQMYGLIKPERDAG